MSYQSKFRTFINDIHLWLGLISGIILFVICLSGTIYTFRSEIEYMINPDKYNVASNSSGKEPIKVENLIIHLEEQEKAKVVSVKIPENPDKNYEFGLVKAQKENTGKEAKPRRSRPVTYYVDPYTGKLAGKDGDSTSKFFITVMKLHRWLLLDEKIGRPIVGVATLIFIILSLSGFILWLPRKFKHWKRWFYWKPGFKIKYKAKWKRINHDLHNTLGFYSAIFLLIMAFTGLCWSFEWYKNGVSEIFGSEVFAGRNEKPVKIEEKGQKTMLNYNEVIDICNNELDYEGDIRINLPKDSSSALSIHKNKTGFFALSASDKLAINPYTGEVIAKDIFKNKPLNVQIVSLIKPLHLGDVFGTFSKIIYFLTCLIGTSLPVTGVIIWINKMRK